MVDREAVPREALATAVIAIKAGEQWHESGCETCARIQAVLEAPPEPETSIHTTLDFFLDEITWKAALPGDHSDEIAEYRAAIHQAVRRVPPSGAPSEPTEEEGT